MLPLITPTLPQAPASQPPGLVTGQLVAGAPPTTQQITAVAVPGTGAPSPYNAQTPQQRSNASPSRLPGVQPERAAILPDPEFWKVPTREANDALANATPVRTPTLPIQVNLTQVSQFTAQVMGQQVQAPAANEQEPPAPPQSRRDASLPGRKPSLGDATGTAAYAIAAQRVAPIDVNEPVNALS